MYGTAQTIIRHTPGTPNARAITMAKDSVIVGKKRIDATWLNILEAADAQNALRALPYPPSAPLARVYPMLTTRM